jgi:hypothetical protein
MTPEQRQAMEEVLRGKRLREVTSQPGWQDALDIFEGIVASAEAQSLNYAGSDKDVCLGLQRRANIARVLFHRFQIDIQQHIEATLVPANVTPVGIPGSW